MEKNIGPWSYSPNPDAVLKKTASPAVFARDKFHKVDSRDPKTLFEKLLTA